jgi:hypothetical protein
MLRHFSDFRRSLEELAVTGRVAVPNADLSVEPITALLADNDG